MIFDRENPPTTAGALDAFAAERGFTLPADYRDFLLRHNGGRPAEANAYLDVPGWNELIVQEFFGLLGNGARSIAQRRFSNFSEPLAGALLSFGTDPGGQALVLDLRPASHGRVYIRAHNDPPQGLPPFDATGGDPNDPADREEAALYLQIAPSFGAFIAALGPVPD